MIVIDRYFDAKTGQYGERELDIPDLITEKEALEIQAAADAKQAEIDRMSALREELVESVIAGATIDQSAREEYIALKEKQAEPAGEAKELVTDKGDRR